MPVAAVIDDPNRSYRRTIAICETAIVGYRMSNSGLVLGES
jgi:hypothetical protein